jgi:acyl-CoA thioesterase FadM
MDGPAILEIDVPAEWIDSNGHLSDYAYGIAFSRALVAFLDAYGLGPAYRSRTSCAIYTLEAHLRYINEILFGDRLSIRYRIVDFDSKRLHLLLLMFDRAQVMAATYEGVLIHVRQHPDEKPRSAELEPSILKQIESAYKAQAGVLAPGLTGRAVSFKRLSA